MLSIKDAPDTRLRKEATLGAPLGRGSRGAKVRLVQELLCLHDCKVVVDGTFGAATEAAVLAFQDGAGLPATGTVDQATIDTLAQPLLRAIVADARPAPTLSGQVVRVARRRESGQGDGAAR